MRVVALLIAALSLTACAPAYEAMPQSSYQWERRQQEIEYREAERRRLCAMMDKTTERYERDCTRPGDPD
ncbi:hypothetical protein [Brevundimonas balnearis]|uniref:Lipoprotein n=1 Tax=Brevundimonas balnearis TaxID=1572858 RepID=A0ABV6QY77_9CAUL